MRIIELSTFNLPTFNCRQYVPIHNSKEAEMETALLDLRFAARMLLKNPGFTITAILTLALGIGANTAVFSVVNAILLRPLPYKEPGKLVLINHNYPKLNLKASVSAPGYVYYRDNAKSFDGVAALSSWSVNLTDAGEPE